jgi:hypothetical protein
MLQAAGDFFEVLFSLAVLSWIFGRTVHVVWMAVLIVVLAKLAGV